MPPNILILMADELRFDLPGFMGNPICRTPALDRLARDAVIFDNAYTPSPVCIPARQCLATGKYPLHTGCERFGQDLPPGSLTFARCFAEHGYLTVACGKLHHRGPDQMQGWLQRIGSECAVNWPEVPAGPAPEQIGRLKWRGAVEILDAGAGESPLALHDRLTTDGACDFLSMHFKGMYRRAPAQPPPVLLLVRFQQPHFPFLTVPELLEYYLPRVHPRLHETPSTHPSLGRGALQCGAEVQPADIRRATAAYYGMVEQADRNFRRVLAALAGQGQNLDDWIIVFCVDHGEMLGEHALWEKRAFYEGSVRVPVFVRAPRRFGPGRRRQNVNLVDIFPTLCDLARIPWPESLDGRSLGPLLADRDARWQNETFSQFDSDEFMLKRGNLKYVTFGNDGPDVLFDLSSDPGETTNRIAESPYIHTAAELRDRLAHFICGTPAQTMA
jgi:choline-sulfatase